MFNYKWVLVRRKISIFSRWTSFQVFRDVALATVIIVIVYRNSTSVNIN